MPNHAMAVTGPLAVIEVGAHAARLQISQVAADGRLELLEQLSQPVPLGTDIYRSGQVSATNTRRVGEMLHDFAVLLRQYGVQRRKAVVTGAVREAVNRDVFLDRVRQISQVDLQVLEEQEEIRLTFLAIKEALKGKYALARRNAVVCMIGPDVSQILFIENGRLGIHETVRLGTLRMKEELGGAVSAQRLREVIDPFIAAVVGGIARTSATAKPELFIAVGSAVRALVELGGRGARQSVITLSRERFQQRFNQILGVNPVQLATRHNLQDAVAQSLEPCGNMLDHFFEITAASQLIVPMVSTRDALLQDLLREITGGEDEFIPEIISAAEHIGEKYSYDPGHAHTVADHARQLFVALQELHGLGPRDRLLLHLAALLHDIGFFVSSRQHHKHSYYLLRNTELPGISPQEQEILALLARYHRRATPRPNHVEYMAVPAEVRVRVSKLAAILRVADALDRSHSHRSGELQITVDENRLVIAGRADDDFTLERFGLDRKADLMKEMFGLKVVLG